MVQMTKPGGQGIYRLGKLGTHHMLDVKGNLPKPANTGRIGFTTKK